MDPGSLVPVSPVRLLHREGARRRLAYLLADRSDVDGLGLRQRAVGPSLGPHQPDPRHGEHQPRRLRTGGARLPRALLRKSTARRGGPAGQQVSLGVAGARMRGCSSVRDCDYGLPCTTAMSAILPLPWQIKQVSTVESAVFWVFVVPRGL